MRVSDLTRSKPTPFTVDLGDGDSVQGMFDRNKVTPAWVESGRNDQFLSDALADVILEWDVTNDDGSPFAISAANMAVFSFDAQARLLEIIVSASVPGRAEGNASANTSDTREQGFTNLPASPQNGQPLSPSPPPSAVPSPT
jgi:hypothetical protein